MAKQFPSDMCYVKYDEVEVDRLVANLKTNSGGGGGGGGPCGIQ